MILYKMFNIVYMYYECEFVGTQQENEWVFEAISISNNANKDCV